MLHLVLAAALSGLPAPVSGDFDRDSAVRLSLRHPVVEANGGYDLVVRSGDSARGQIRVMTLKSTTLSDFYLGKAAEGVEATVCAKGLGRATDPCAVKSVTIAGDTLQFGTRESSRAVAVWADDRFQVVWLDD